MHTKSLLSASLLSLSASLLPIAPAHADTVLASSVGFITGTQSFTDSFNITTPGTLSVTLESVPWLDTLQDLSCFLTSSAGALLGQLTSAQPGTPGFEQEKVNPGTVYLSWYGIDSGPVGVGVYSVTVDFQPAAPVPLPAALPLLLSGLGALAVYRRRRSVEAPG
jgi:hypothetical protein